MLLDRGRFHLRQRLDPVLRIPGHLAGCNAFKNPVKHWIAGRLAIGNHHALKVCVEPVSERQLHQDGACQGQFQRRLANRQENTFLVVQEEQNDFFRESQH